MGMGQAMQTMQELGDLDQLENLLRNATNPGALAEADMDRVRDLMGDDAARSLERLAELTKMLEEAGLIEQKEGRLELTPEGTAQDRLERAARPVPQAGQGQGRPAPDGPSRARATSAPTRPSRTSTATRSTSTCTRTIRNALRRNGAGTPVQLSPDDFEIERTEHLTKSSTVLMLDLSLSMPMRDNFLPAKKVAMALHSLITSQFPRDYMGIVGFSETARVLTAAAAPGGVLGLRLRHQHAARFSAGPAAARPPDRHQADHHDHRRRADGAHHAERRRVLQLPAGAARPIEATLREVMRCTQGQHPHQHVHARRQQLPASRSSRQLTSINRGRAFFTTPETLGDYVLVDFIEHSSQLAAVAAPAE